MTRVMFMAEAFQTSADALRRVEEVLAAPVIGVPATPRAPADNSVRFEDVSFTYDGAAQPALSNVTFDVPAGSTVALVGPSGGGKTTAASLVPRFWDVGEGRVLVGGVDVRDMDPHDLMERVAFVFQANRLFRQSVLDNVRAARPDARREDVLAALSAAQCDDILAKLPQGVDTVVGADGTHLSGGEVQRLMIARAILKDAPIVVLDEATAFADPENEARIQAAFKRLARGKDGRPRTVLMIAHRLSTVRNADRIVVLDGGRVVEQGSHEELRAAGGLYARHVGGLRAGSELEDWPPGASCRQTCRPGRRRCPMSIKEKYALTDKGVRNVWVGAAWTAAANLVVFGGTMAFFLLVQQLVACLVDGAPLPGLVPYLVGLTVFIVALFVAEYWAYYFQYGVIYGESGRQRIALAERLRRLPLSFFGRRDLADLTETLMTDVKTTEHAYSHVLPELYGAYITLGVASACLLVFDWRLALASLWSCPVALALLFGARRALQPMMHATRMKGLAASEDIQEALECVREVRATNPGGALPRAHLR